MGHFKNGVFRRLRLFWVGWLSFEGRRGQVSERCVGALLVVGDHPVVEGFADFGEVFWEEALGLPLQRLVFTHVLKGQEENRIPIEDVTDAMGEALEYELPYGWLGGQGSGFGECGEVVFHPAQFPDEILHEIRIDVRIVFDRS